MPQIRLLFVDDEPAIRITLPAILKQKGFDVMTAASVPEALNLMNAEKFEVLISDLNIGEPGDGFTVVSAMRRVQPEAATFILTGYPDFESALLAIRNQVDDYLTKPAEVNNLRRNHQAAQWRKPEDAQTADKASFRYLARECTPDLRPVARASVCEP
jgi:DNA-binding NtrC family response regulator